VFPWASSTWGLSQETRATRADYVHADDKKRNNFVERVAAVGEDALAAMSPRTLDLIMARREREKQARLARDLELQVAFFKA
jgi:hypothetical protein